MINAAINAPADVASSDPSLEVSVTTTQQPTMAKNPFMSARRVGPVVMNAADSAAVAMTTAITRGEDSAASKTPDAPVGRNPRLEMSTDHHRSGRAATAGRIRSNPMHRASTVLDEGA